VASGQRTGPRKEWGMQALQFGRTAARRSSPMSVATAALGSSANPLTNALAYATAADSTPWRPSWARSSAPPAGSAVGLVLDRSLGRVRLTDSVPLSAPRPWCRSFRWRRSPGRRTTHVKGHRRRQAAARGRLLGHLRRPGPGHPSRPAIRAELANHGLQIRVGCTPARSSSSATTSAGSRSTSPPGSSPVPGPGKCDGRV
jgi:hypothetical protein